MAYTHTHAAGPAAATIDVVACTRMFGTVARKVLRGLLGDLDELRPAAATTAGLAAAAVGHLRGTLDLRDDRIPVPLTVGLDAL
jgi:hypothetical protein